MIISHPYHMNKQKAGVLFSKYCAEEDFIKGLLIMVVDVKAEYFPINQRDRLYSAYSSGSLNVDSDDKKLIELFSFINLPKEHKATLKTKAPKWKELMVKTRALAKTVFKGSSNIDHISDGNISLSYRCIYDHICIITNTESSAKTCPAWHNGYNMMNMVIPEYLLENVVDDFNRSSACVADVLNNFKPEDLDHKSMWLSNYLRSYTERVSNLSLYYPIDVVRHWNIIRNLMERLSYQHSVNLLASLNNSFIGALYNCEEYFEFVFNCMDYFHKNTKANLIYNANMPMRILYNAFDVFFKFYTDERFNVVIDLLKKAPESLKCYLKNFYMNQYSEIIKHINTLSDFSNDKLRALHSLLDAESFKYLQSDIIKACNNVGIFKSSDDKKVLLLKELHPELFAEYFRGEMRRYV